MYRSNWSFNMPPGQTPGIWHLYRPGEEGIWLSESSREWGIWSPCVGGGEFELHPRFHVKTLAWRAIMGDAVLGDFRGKDCFKYMNVWKLCLQWPIYRRFNATIKSSTEVNITLTCRMYKVSDDSCQWNGHDVVGGIFFIERFLCCMTHEEKLSIQWPCSSNFRRFARDFCS